MEPLKSEFEERIFVSVMRQGGKKKLDTLLGLFKSEAPKRVAEIEAAGDSAELKGAATVLKSSAANLGLLGLEDLCDQVIASGSAALKPQFKPALDRALVWLEGRRKALTLI